MEKITILTRPTGTYLNSKRKYGGHIAVTRSLIEGLEKINYCNYNYGPLDEKDIGPIVHVLAGVDTLEYAIELKRKGIVKKLSAGPNIVVFPSEYNSIATNDLIDFYMLPCEWNKRKWQELEPKFKSRIEIWPAGVDTSFFCGRKESDIIKGKVLVYHKNESDQFRYRLCNILKQYGYTPIVIKYGKKSDDFNSSNDMKGVPNRYTHEEFRDVLKTVEFSVVISDSESQGIALAEMWSMDVPTICFDPCYHMWDYNGIIYERVGDVSSCPYLSKETGLKFENVNEFEKIIKRMWEIKNEFKPRKWVLENMSDECSAIRFVNIMENRYGK